MLEELFAFGSEKNCWCLVLKGKSDSLTKALNLEKPCILKADLDRPNIFPHKEKRKAASSGAGSLSAYSYLLLNWCEYAFKLFLDILGDASYFSVNAEKIPENCL